MHGVEGLPFERRRDHADRLAPRSLYLHVPFCFHKCHYCDFYSLVADPDLHEAFVRAIIIELELARRFVSGSCRTVFVGGGTPSLLAPRLWEPLLGALRTYLSDAGAESPAAGASPPELTVEMNPETVTPDLVRVLAAGGVNRVSIGAQSFRPGHLATLERWHEPASVGRAVDAVRAAGIENVNLDLIFAVPGGTTADWSRDLDEALRMEPEHLSCYALTYEPNTPLAGRLRRGKVTRVDPDVEAFMYETTLDRLGAAGFGHYEISNWARPGRRCRHNLAYWTNEQWWPVGPSASGHAGGCRWKNAPRRGAWQAALERGAWPPITDAERLDEDARAGEALMLRIRLVDGIAPDLLADLVAEHPARPGGARRRAAIERHREAGLLEEAGGRLRLSRRGLLLADTVAADLL